MPKNIENFNPFREEYDEETNRLYKNDKQHNYVPIDQIADPGGNILEHLAGPKNKQKDSSGDMNEDQDTIQAKLEDKELKFQQHEGVASIGPDVVGEAVKERDLYSPKKNLEKGSISSERGSMSPDKVSPNVYVRKHSRNSGMEHNNLKTIPDLKQQRNSREHIAKFLDEQTGNDFLESQ